MPITRQQRLIHRQFLQRQTQHERRYARRFRSLLAKQYRASATAYPDNYQINPKDYQPILEQLYSTVLPQEAKYTWDMYVKPLSGDKKDFFDDLMAILGINVPEGEFIRLWRDVSKQWLAVNILTKITSIAQTTQRAIAKIIERAVNEGSSINEISKKIQQEANGEVNEARATMIARTEVVGAMNKGRRLSMHTSNLLWNKQWVDTPDERTRMSHRAIAREDWRPLDDQYWLTTTSGGLEPADCPGDPRLSAGNLINCRCTEVYEVQRDAAGRPVRRGNTPVSLTEALEVIA